MEFLKKNTLLSVVLIVTVVASMGLIVFVFKTKSQMLEFQGERGRNADLILSLNKNPISPTAENLQLLQTRYSELNSALTSSLRQFGAPLRNSFVEIAKALAFETDSRFVELKRKSAAKDFEALVSFVSVGSKADKAKFLEVFGESDESNTFEVSAFARVLEADLYSDFTEFYKTSKETSDMYILSSFLQKKANRVKSISPGSLYEKVKLAFWKGLEVKDESGLNTVLEPVGDVDSWILNAFGVSLVMDNIPRKSKKYLARYQNNLITYLDEVYVLNDAKHFSFGEFLEKDRTGSFPDVNHIPHIVRFMRGVAGFIVILKEEDVFSINSIKRVGDIEGKLDDSKEFTSYRFEISFTSSIQSVRNTLNRIEMSQHDGHTFVVDDLKLVKTVDGVSGFNQRLNQLKEQDDRQAQVYTKKGLKDPRKLNAKFLYGATLLGNDRVTVTMVLSNVVYRNNEFVQK